MIERQRPRRTLAALVWPVAYDAALAMAKVLMGAKLTRVDEGGAESLQGTTPLIIAANHQGHLDYDSMLMAVPRRRRRRLRYVSSELLLARLGEGRSASAHVQRRILRGIYTYIHRVIPVGGEVRGAAAVAAMADALADGDTVVIFPEGARNRDQGLSALRPGVGFWPPAPTPRCSRFGSTALATRCHHAAGRRAASLGSPCASGGP